MNPIGTRLYLATEGVIVLRALQAAYVAVCLGFAALPSSAIAGPMQIQQSQPAKSSSSVSVHIITVRATKAGTTDPNLRAMEKQMHSRGFRGFRMANSTSKSVSTSDAGRFSLTKRYATQVRLVSRTATHATLRIRVLKDGELHHKADVTLPNNQGYITVVKPEDNSAAIVLAITPRF